MRNAASDRGLGVVGKQWRHSIDTSRLSPGAVEFRPKQIGGPSQVLQSQFNEQLFAGETSLGLLADAAVIRRRIAIAASNIVGLDVRPVTDNSST